MFTCGRGGCSVGLSGGRFPAHKIGGVIRTARAVPARHARIRAEWTRAGNAARGSCPGLVLRRYNLIRRNAIFNPPLQSAAYVVLWVALAHGALTENVWARASATILHPRHHVQPQKRAAILSAHLRYDTLVVVNRIHRRNRRIAPTVIHNQFSAPLFECSEVRIRSVQPLRHLVVGNLGVVVHVERLKVPGRVVENHILVELRSESEEHALSRRWTGDPGRPSSESGFPARRDARENLLALRIQWPVIDFLQSGHLRRSETGIGFRRASRFS